MSEERIQANYKFKPSFWLFDPICHHAVCTNIWNVLTRWRWWKCEQNYHVCHLLFNYNCYFCLFSWHKLLSVIHPTVCSHKTAKTSFTRSSSLSWRHDKGCHVDIGAGDAAVSPCQTSWTVPNTGYHVSVCPRNACLCKHCDGWKTLFKIACVSLYLHRDSVWQMPNSHLGTKQLTTYDNLLGDGVPLGWERTAVLWNKDWLCLTQILFYWQRLQDYGELKGRDRVWVPKEKKKKNQQLCLFCCQLQNHDLGWWEWPFIPVSLSD